MKLPEEDGLREHIRSELAAEQQLALEVLAVGTDLLKNDLTLNTDQPPTDDEVWLSLGIISKACRQYRAIGALVDLGLGEVAMSNCRMLIETSLASLFLMTPQVQLRRGGKPYADIPNFPLTTAFRAQLYVANDALSLEKTVRMMHEGGSLAGPDPQATINEAAKLADEVCAPIGPEWRKRLKESSSFSGLKIHDLADSFGRRADYAVFYRPASPGVHGADARKWIRVEREGDKVAFSFNHTGEGSATSLMLASLAFLDVLEVASLRYGIGLDERTNALRQKVLRMKAG